ncbi:hypothetical protein FOBRF1_013404 [Fusarium oxysporum]
MNPVEEESELGPKHEDASPRNQLRRAGNGHPYSYTCKFEGITPLYEDKNGADVDIIAVPGHGSHALGSWKSPNSDEVWLRDFLPKDVPNIRVLLYGYDTTLPGSLSKQSIEDLGGALLEQIIAYRAGDGTSHRPIIFTGHSLGGLLIKQALVRVRRRHHDANSDLSKASYGLLFFGVPNLTRSKQASKKPKDQYVTAMPSPYVSLPIGRRKKKSRTVESDDENGAMALNGNANEGLMVNDNEDEEAFEVLPDHQPLRPLSRSSGLPIPLSAELEDLNEIHRDIVDGFVQEAKVAEEKIRKRKGLRSTLFTEKELQVMAIRWTTSLNKMSKIPGIQLDKVMIHGPEVLRILRRYYSGYREVMDPKCSGSNDQEIVDLLSSDAEMGGDTYEDEDGEDSPYFNTNRHADIWA